MNRKRITILSICTMAAMVMPLCGLHGISAVLAAESSAVNSGHTAYNGMVDLGQGDAEIMIIGNNGQSLSGKCFEMFQLFNAEKAENNESVNYTFNEKYKQALQNVTSNAMGKDENTEQDALQITEYQVIDYIQSLSSEISEKADTEQKSEGYYSQFRYFVEDLRDEIKSSGLSGEYIYVDSADTDNTVTVSGLQYGYYVIDEVSGSDADGGEWYASALCMVDTASPSASIHIKSDYPDVTKKIKEDDGADSIGGDGWNDIGDYEIGQIIPFKFESLICNMNGYDTYYYAWHDQMDEALTFQNDKNRIQIIISNGKKEYSLKSDEYNVITDPACMDSGDTFMIEIDDIKQIADREFDKKNHLGHNDYSGITVTLIYEAVLNDLAADRTGRPGFENNVRLEFSNDADVQGKGETGYTPWDTVVCFTFQLCGSKINEAGLPLEGAGFRLYSDEECRNEVFVKAKPNESGSYIVINRDSLGGEDHTGGSVPEEAAEMCSSEDGNFTIYGLDQGIYYLKETSAPAGYRQLTEPVVLTVSPQYTSGRNNYVPGEGATSAILKELKAEAHISEFYEGLRSVEEVTLNTDEEEGTIELSVINRTGSRLPVTGSAAMPALMGTGAVLVCGTFFWNRKRSNEREKQNRTRRTL